jgi:hypothetical protein
MRWWSGFLRNSVDGYELNTVVVVDEGEKWSWVCELGTTSLSSNTLQCEQSISGRVNRRTSRPEDE